MRSRFRVVAVACAVGLLGPTLPSRANGIDSELAIAALVSPTPAPTSHTSVLIRDALLTSNKYFLNTWWEENLTVSVPLDTWTTRLRARGTIDSEHVRRFSSVALAIAAPLATNTYNPKVTGVATPVARLRVADLIGVLVRTHIANVPHRAAWGGTWQSALWASQAAVAGFLVGDALTPADQALLARMLAFEADAVTNRSLHYLRDRNGNYLRRGNSGADELAWDGVAVYTAVELLPEHPRRAQWAEAAYQRFVAAYALPSDVTSNRVVNGRRLRDWLDGSNVEPSGWVVNHGRLSPDYTVGYTPHAAVVAGLVGSRYPEAIRHNQSLLYRNIVEYPFTSPRARKPGGTVYRPNSAALYYPYGVDWGTSRQVLYATLDIEIDVLDLGTRLRTSPRTWARRHFEEVRRMQRRSDTGQMYGAHEENTYFAREEHGGALLAWAHLADTLGAAGRLRPTSSSPAAKGPR